MAETLPLIGAVRHPNTLRDVPIRMAKADANFLRNREIHEQIGAALGRDTRIGLAVGHGGGAVFGAITLGEER